MTLPKLNVCRNCGTIWYYHYDNSIAIDDYKNLGWHLNCKCGLAYIASIWHPSLEEAAANWNNSTFSKGEKDI